MRARVCARVCVLACVYGGWMGGCAGVLGGVLSRQTGHLMIIYSLHNNQSILAY